jgi:hypothetical protein
LVKVGLRRPDPALIDRMGATGILQSVITVEFGGLLQLADAGGGAPCIRKEVRSV